MQPERARRVEQLYHTALEREESERQVFLDNACAGDAELRVEIESLLRHEKQSDQFIDRRPLDALAAAIVLQPEQSQDVFVEEVPLHDRTIEKPPDTLYHLLHKLGEGGMGQVWLAEQTSPVRRQVALKLIKAGMYDQAVVQRFEAERQSLAIMDHPAIAKVFDAGATPQGQPYFVMEYVQGLPITEYCDQKKLKIRDRLELFIQVCDGVQHAHQKAIIHRDLKPANILVVEVDGKPVPRIIDFGLAKATAPQVAGRTILTQMGHFMGTPGYMSPEQADPGVQEIDTRTDVYSLAVVLYVLLTGSQPFDTKKWRGQPLEEVMRTLREEEPPRPSAKVSSDRDTSAATAEARCIESRQLVSLLRGDLDWITMKGLEKDRARRYSAPSELAADIRRYLGNEPVVARPASTSYRLQKYVRRHRAAVIVVSGAAILLLAFAVAQAFQLRRTTQERDRASHERDHATRERDRANRITDFMTGMFKVSDPSEARGNSVTAREILDKSSKEMETGLAKDPEVQAQMMQVMARTYGNLGLYPRAHELAKRALDARLNLLGPDDPKTLESMTQMGWILEKEGRYAEAEKLERQALAGERRVLGPGDPLTLETMGDLSFVVLGQHRGSGDGEGEKLAREAIELGRRTLGPESAQVLLSVKNLGNALWYQGRYAEAEQEYRQLLDAERRVAGPDHPDTLTAMRNLALAIKAQGRFAEAEPLAHEALITGQRVLGPEHPLTIEFLYNLAAILFDEGRLADAEKLYRESLATQARTLGPEHPSTLISKSELSDVLFREGHVHEAERLQRETLSARIRIFGPESRLILASQADLARTLNKEGRYAEAEKLAQGAFEAGIRAHELHGAVTLYALRQLGKAMAYSHHYPDADKLFRNLIENDNDSDPANPGTVWSDFACAAAAANRPDDALQYLREAINHGYKHADALMADDDLKNLHSNPKFQQLVAELKHPSTKVPTQ